MQRSELDRVVDEIRSFFTDNTTRMTEQVGRHPASAYSDPDWAARERRMLARYPMILGHESQIPNAGDFRTDDSTGVPVLLVRQADGAIKAFLNICRHRGARLCTEEAGNRRLFVCPYHAWSFKTDGALMQTPRPEGFDGLERESYGLAELPCEVRHGLIWVQLERGSSIDVAAHLGRLDDELAAYGMADMVMERDEDLDFDMNWKFVIDGFLEVYHFAKLHQNSISPYFYGWHSPWDEFGRNGRLIGVRKSFDTIRDADTSVMSNWDLLKTIAVNYVLFPNTVLVWQGDHFESWTAYPGKRPDTCRVRVQSITRKEDAVPEKKEKWDRNWKILIGTVVAEDWAMCKTIQEVAPYMPGDELIFGRNEPGLHHFHGQIQAATDQMNT
mgnify:CR=1 FL=1